MKRPTGVTIVAVIGIIYGIFSLLLAFLGVVGIALEASGAAVVASRVASTYDVGKLTYAVISDGILGVLYLVFGISAFSLKGWAWTIGVVALVLDILRHLVGDIFISGIGVISIITIVIALLLLWYLFTPNVRAAFGRAA